MGLSPNSMFLASSKAVFSHWWPGTLGGPGTVSFGLLPGPSMTVPSLPSQLLKVHDSDWVGHQKNNESGRVMENRLMVCQKGMGWRNEK